MSSNRIVELRAFFDAFKDHVPDDIKSKVMLHSNMTDGDFHNLILTEFVDSDDKLIFDNDDEVIEHVKSTGSMVFDSYDDAAEDLMDNWTKVSSKIESRFKDFLTVEDVTIE